MEGNNLLKKLDLEMAEEFRFFENFADLMEHDESLDEDEVYDVFSKTDREAISEIINSYFDEIMESFEEEGELYTLLELIKNNLVRLLNEEGALSEFSEELLKVKDWFAISQNVEAEEIETGEVSFISILEALSNIRLEKMGSAKYKYDFNSTLDYEVDEYVMSVDMYADISEEEED